MAKTPVNMDKHHRRPRSRGGSNNANNISIVDRKLHVAWHSLVGNMTAPEAARMLSDTWIDPEFYFVAIPRQRASSKKRRKRKYCVDCEAEVLKMIPKTSKEE